MQKLVELKQKIKTVNSIKAVAKTLATVSAAKLSRAKNKAAGLRDYTAKMREVLEEQQASLRLSGFDPVSFSPLLQEKPVTKKVVLFMVTGDRGMCGNYNLALIHLALDFLRQKNSEGIEVEFAVKGKKGEYYLKKRKADIIFSESWPRYGISAADSERMTSYLTGLFLENKTDEVYAAFTHYYTPIKRVPTVKRILPVIVEPSKTGFAKPGKWYYEPSAGDIITELIRVYIGTQIFDLLIESYASEQGARMITMEEASERADKALHEYKVKFNRLRRESITTDLLGALFAAKVVTGRGHDAAAGVTRGEE